MMLKNKILQIGAKASAAVLTLTCAATQAATPICSSTDFDTDGDGWGWENFQSCIVSSGTTESDSSIAVSSSNKNNHPLCSSASVDKDQDGWGWENERSCIVASLDDADAQVSDDSTETPADPSPTTDASDTNNDTNNTADTTRPICTLASSDPDNDGWGWENNRSCIVQTADTNAPDSDADIDGGTDADAADPDTEKNSPDAAIVYQQNFENASSGLYQSDQLNAGWNTPFWHLGFDQGRVKIVPDPQHSQVMQVTFPAGNYGSDAGSAFLSDVQFGMELPKSYDELYLSYDMKFADNFDFVLGGKLPGLCGANSDQALTQGCNTGGGKPSGFDGWSARGMWRVDGTLENYTYHAGQQNFYADSLRWDARAERGTWHKVQHRVVLNTVGVADGILEAWLDGVKVLQNTQIEYRKTESVGINLFYFSTFFGGNDSNWAPSTDQFIYFDNFVIATEKQN